MSGLKREQELELAGIVNNISHLLLFLVYIFLCFIEMTWRIANFLDTTEKRTFESKDPK